MNFKKDNSDYVKQLIKKLSEIEYIKPGEIPNIDLYMDQVTTFMDSHLDSLKRHADDKILTKTMINNYAKNNLLPPPVKKKYSKEHLLILIFIYYFKNILSISDIQSLLSPLTEKYFKKDTSPSLEEIYKEVFELERSQIGALCKDIIEKYKNVDAHFSEKYEKCDDISTDENINNNDTFNTTDANHEDIEFLKLFSFVCMLSFDVYIKKQMIESIIDDLNISMSDNKNEKDKGKKDK